MGATGWILAFACLACLECAESLQGATVRVKYRHSHGGKTGGVTHPLCTLIDEVISGEPAEATLEKHGSPAGRV